MKREKHPRWKAFQPELSRSSEDSSTTSTSLSDFEDFIRPGTNLLQLLLISTLGHGLNELRNAETLLGIFFKFEYIQNF